MEVLTQMKSAIEVITTWDEFRRKWDSRQNFILRGEVFPYKFSPPPLADVIETVRRHKDARMLRARYDDDSQLYATVINDPDTEYRNLPVEQAMKIPSALAHFELLDFAGSGQVFEGLEEVFGNWYDSLKQHGFSWISSQRALFLSGPHTNTAYHYDSSYVLAWQLAGTKRFCWLKEPERWCDAELRRETADFYDKMRRPEGITSDDVIECEMQPGDVLWNVMLTPHWVYSLDETAWSINITHFQLRCDEQLSDIDLELQEVHRRRAELADSRC